MKLPQKTPPGIAILALLVGNLMPANAQQGDRPGHVMKPPPAEWKIPAAPVVPVNKALETFAVPEGFHVEIVASEPDIHDPVAIAFDGNGRIWVAQMISFMPDVNGTGEGKPLGKITILEDSDGDGKVDKSKVFLDKIILPRALALADADHGLLYADDRQLYHIEIKDDDRPGKQEVIDPTYGVGKNVEHKANGLLYGLDNWYYNADTTKKFRRENGKWITGKTEKRGQWGISQDDYGRLATNTNSNFISVEIYPPGITTRNPNHTFKTPTTARLKKQQTWPSRITSGINRGYLDGFLTKDGYLNGPTAACSSEFYRGDNFPDDFYGNLFLPEPAGNLVKRAIISEQHGIPSIRQAYDKKEFLTSSDERSRIVNAYTAPDGTLYLVDFYRGILQHGAFLTTYLRNEILSRDLDKPIGLGRIYRVVSDKKKPRTQARLSETDSIQLVSYLSDANGWVRDTAQRLIVQRRDLSAVPALRSLLNPAMRTTDLSRIHALWTLQGMGALTPADIGLAAKSTHPKIVTNAIRAAEVFANGEKSGQALKQLASLTQRKNIEIKGQLCASLGLFRNTPEQVQQTFNLLLGILKNAPTDETQLRDLTLSSLHNIEPEFLSVILTADGSHPITHDLIAAIIKSGNQDNITALNKSVTSSQLAADTRRNLIKQLASAIMVSKQTALIRNLLNQASSLDASERESLASGFLEGKKSIKGRYRPLNMGTQKPDLLTNSDLLKEAQRQKLAALFDYTGGKKVVYLKTAADKKQYTLGKTHYERICFACHQANGNGSPFLAPPLVDSEWILESPDRLIALVMDGMTGPVTVNGITYRADTAPQVQPLMPGVRINPELNDEQIAAILTYVRNTWGNGASPVSQKTVANYRKQHKARLPFTEAELKKIK